MAAIYKNGTMIFEGMKRQCYKKLREVVGRENIHIYWNSKIEYVVNEKDSYKVKKMSLGVDEYEYRW